MESFNFSKIFIYFKNAPLRIKEIGLGRYIAKILILFKMNYKNRNKIIRYIKILIEPVKYYKSLNTKFYTDNLNNLSICNESKSLFLDKSKLLGTKELLDHCRNIYLEEKNKIQKSYVYPYYMLLDLAKNPLNLSERDVKKIKPILKFASQNLLIGLVAKHIKQVPVIAGITLNYTKAMEKSQKYISAQQYHRDLNDKSLLHLVIPIYDINEDSGPFTYVDIATSKKIIQAINGKEARINDSLINKYAKNDNIIKLTGEAGSAWFMSPYYSIHCGARVKKGFRLLLIITYAAPNLAVECVGFLHRKSYQKKLMDSNSSHAEKNLLKVYS